MWDSEAQANGDISHIIREVDSEDSSGEVVSHQCELVVREQGKTEIIENRPGSGSKASRNSKASQVTGWPYLLFVQDSSIYVCFTSTQNTLFWMIN